MFWPGLRQGYSPEVSSSKVSFSQEGAPVDHLEVVDDDAFLVDGGGQRGHGARRHAAHVGMVAAAGGVEQDGLAVRVEHRRDHGDVGQVGAAIVGRVEHEDVAGVHHRVVGDDGLHGFVHGPQVHRHVRRVGDELAIGVEYRAGEVEPLLDVHRVGGLFQRHAHLFGDRHEQVVEHFQHDRIGGGADGELALCRHGAGQHHVVEPGDRGLPAGLDHGGVVRLDDERRAGDAHARLQGSAVIQRCFVPFTTGMDAGGVHGLCVAAGQRVLRLCGVRATANGFHCHGLDDDVGAGRGEAELRLVRGFKGFAHGGGVCQVDVEG